MYGLILHNLQAFLTHEFGDEVYHKIRIQAGLEEFTYCVHKRYPDEILMKVVETASIVTGRTKDSILHGMGVNFPHICGEYGYYKMLKTVGRNLKEFVNGLDYMHDCLRFSYPGMRTPSFYCDEETEDGLRLHYRSKRFGYVHYVCGQLEEMANYIFNMQIKAEIENETVTEEGTHAVIRLHFLNKVEGRKVSTGVNQICPTISTEMILGMFPFHLLFREDMKMFGVGESLEKVLPGIDGQSVKDIFELKRPTIPFTWASIRAHPNCVFELIARIPVVNNSDIYENNEGEELCFLHLKGQMKYVQTWNAFMYLASPVLENIDHMFNIGLYLNDLSLHDASRDLVLVGNQKSAELKIALDQELQKSAMLEDSMKKLDVEMQKTDKLLYNMIPKSVADRLRSGDLAVNTCENFQNATILFSDIVGFTHICSVIHPMQVVQLLNTLYTKFDNLSEKHSVYKVETIGDAYMVVSGVPERIQNHGERVADMALEMLNAVLSIPQPSNSRDHLKVRIGIHSGSVVAGVVGIKMPRYCLFGDAVNTASRMESHSAAMSIHMSETTKKEIEGKKYLIRKRGRIMVKGKGSMQTYWLLGKGDSKGAVAFMSLKSVEQSAGVIENMMMDMEQIMEESSGSEIEDTSQPKQKRMLREFSSSGNSFSRNQGPNSFTQSFFDADEENAYDIDYRALREKENGRIEFLEKFKSSSANETAVYVQMNGSKDRVANSNKSKKLFPLKNNSARSAACIIL